MNSLPLTSSVQRLHHCHRAQGQGEPDRTPIRPAVCKIQHRAAAKEPFKALKSTDVGRLCCLAYNDVAFNGEYASCCEHALESVGLFLLPSSIKLWAVASSKPPSLIVATLLPRNWTKPAELERLLRIAYAHSSNYIGSPPD
ncbi:uncharacterized protein VTP21DRAFT_5664 [Calcarisporiella thermophila]|uniref:uncharacterized protein n=1 Tax=Calcarisporiella thermophila TaxID=911321 RepID=UPI003742DB31